MSQTYYFSKRTFSYSVFLIHSKYRANKILLSIKQKTDRIKFPDKLRGTVIERWADYWKRLSLDYIEVGQDVVKSSRENPIKLVSLLSSLGILYTFAKTNPDEISFREDFLKATSDVTMVGKEIRNPLCESYLQSMEGHFNEGTVKYFSFGFFSILWRDNYSDDLKTFKATCSYLEPRFVDFNKRILDFGFLNKWWVLDKMMVDYDINPYEWEKAVSKETNDSKEE